MTSGENSDGFIVVCKNEDPSPENKQMSMYLVPANAKGVTIEPLNKIGMQIMPFSKVIFDDVVVDESALLGIEGKGFLQLMKNFEWERCVLLAELLGEAQAAMDDACAWTNERQQFGKGIKTFQLVQEHIVEMQIELTNTRNFLYRTCWKMDNGIPVNNDAAMLKRDRSPGRSPTAAPAPCSSLGGLGFTDEYPRLPRNLMLVRELPDRWRHRRDHGAHLRPRHPQGVRQGCRGSGSPLGRHPNRVATAHSFDGRGLRKRVPFLVLGIDLGEVLRKVLLAARCALFPPANAAKEIANGASSVGTVPASLLLEWKLF